MHGYKWTLPYCHDWASDSIYKKKYDLDWKVPCKFVQVICVGQFVHSDAGSAKHLKLKEAM